MDGVHELEDGEIEELSDAEIISQNKPNFEEISDLEENITDMKDFRTYNSSQALHRSESSASSRSKTLLAGKNNNGTNMYDMDDYQLLLARHQLIQQQLTKVLVQESKNQKRKKENKHLLCQRKSRSRTQSKPGKSLDFFNKSAQKGNNTINQDILFNEQNENIENDDELSELRTALLAQTMKGKKKKLLSNNQLVGAGKENVTNIFPNEIPVTVNNTTIQGNFGPTNEYLIHSLPLNEAVNVTAQICNNQDIVFHRGFLGETDVLLPNFNQQQSGSSNFANEELLLTHNECNITGMQVTPASVVTPKSNTIEVINISDSEDTSQLPDISVDKEKHFQKKTTVSNNKPTSSTNTTLKEILKEKKKEKGTTRRMELKIPKSIAIHFPKASSIKTSRNHFPVSIPLQPVRKKRRKRAGKRTKYLAHRAQQKIELEILQQQQEKIDNYSNVPMDIEDDDLSEGLAPLPLIETRELLPPPPPDAFEPVLDQTALSMTNNTVAWMPGYVETLENQIDVNQSGFDSGKSANIIEIVIEEHVSQSKTSPEQAMDKMDENEVWALRAQALKSLACKRATKVKEQNKEKKIALNVTDKTFNESISEPGSPLVIPNVSPGHSPATNEENLTKKSLKGTLPTNNYRMPPKHPPVIICLTKDDFEDSDDDTTYQLEDKQRLYPTKKHLQLQKMNSRKRKSISDENLLKELQNAADKASSKIKQCSSHIVKDQISYKKLQGEISEKKALFDKQTQEVKELQLKLHSAMKEKAATRKAHNKLHGQIKDVKERLKENIGIKKHADDEILRAKSLVSVSRLKLNGKGIITDTMKGIMTTLLESIQSSVEQVTAMGESSQDETHDSISSVRVNSTSSERAKNELAKTAADVKHMKKSELAKLELELREKLKMYRASQNNNTALVTERGANDTKESVSIDLLPLVVFSSDLKKLQKNLSLELKNKMSYRKVIMQDFSKLKNSLDLKVMHISAEKLDTTSEEDALIKLVHPNAEYKKYRTVLTRFRSYRLNPYYRTQSKYNIQSSTFSNRIQPKKIMCKYDLLGTCNDKTCKYWHFKDQCNLPLELIVQDLVSYDLKVFNATPIMSGEKKRKLLVLFTKQFFQQYEGKMSSDEILLLLWNQLKETRQTRKESPFECISFQKRDWFLYNKGTALDDNLLVEQYNKPKQQVYFLKSNKKKNQHDKIGNDETYECQEVRYFSETYNSMEVLKTALSNDPSDIKLWLALSNFYFKQNKPLEDMDASNAATKETSLENALAILSQGLEENRDSEDLWIRYLKLFSKNSSPDELRELCYQAVMYAATYTVWWTCLNLESSYIGQQEICTEMIKFVLESDEAADRKSHYLLESVLFVARLLVCRGKVLTAISYISAALGREELQVEEEKIEMRDITFHLTAKDRSLTWLSLISLHVFGMLPNFLFKDEEDSAGRIVRKEEFLLDWKNLPWNLDSPAIRNLFNDALLPNAKRSKATMKSMIILHQNYVAFEVSSQNVKAAVDHVHSLLKKEPMCVDGWILLLSLYIDYSPDDAVVTVAEDAVHKCDYDVEVVYLYSQWLFKKGMPGIALEKLTKCIHTYFQFAETEQEIPDVFYLYRKLLGLPVPHTIKLSAYLPDFKTSQHLALYYWLCYCLLLKIRKTPPTILIYSSSVDEAYESAVHQYTSRENTMKLWYSYIQHRIECLCKQQSVSTEEYQAFEDLLFRCLASVHTSVVIPYSKQLTFKDYSYHNKVLELCLSYVPKRVHSAIYRKAIRYMPDNVALSIRICEHEYADGNYEQTRVICAAMLIDNPRCINLWNMAIKVELKCNCVKEARWLFQEATAALPFSSILWKDFIKFEIAYAKGYDQLNNVLEGIVNKATQHGVDLKGFVSNLSPTC